MGGFLFFAMFRLSVALVLFVCIGAAFGNHGARVLLGGFEGTYTSEFGLGMFICQDGNFVYGYSDESFLFRGTVDALDVMTGTFYKAGSGPCATGTIELDLTTWGVEGFYICSNGKVVTMSSVRLNEFTPDDDGGDDDDETVQTSFQLQNRESGETEDYFAAGFWYESGRVFVGTYYKDFLAGPLLMYLTPDGDVHYSIWTGLFKQEGETFLDGSQANNPALHWTGHFQGPRSSSTANQCTRFEVLQTFVLKNLRAIQDDDEDYYYFIDEKYLSYSAIEYLNLLSDSSSASTVVFSTLFVTIGLLAALF